MNKIIIKPKSIVITVIVVDLIILIMTEPLFRAFHKSILVDYEESYLEPLFYGSLIFLLSVLIFFFVSRNQFKNWVKYIVSWYLPVSVFFISQINIYSSSVMSIDRVTAAVYWMLGLFVITLIFVVVSVKGKGIKSTFLS